MRHVRLRTSGLSLRPFHVLVAVAGVAALGMSIGALMVNPVGPSWFVLVGLTVVTGWSTLRMRDAPVSFSISDTFTIASALLFGPAAGTVTVAVDALVMSLRVARAIRKVVWTHLIFNATATALAMFVSAHVFFALAGTGPLATDPGRIRDLVVPLLIFAWVNFLLNGGLIASAIAHERGVPLVTVWREDFSGLWITYFSGASIAGVLVLMTAARVVDVKTLTLILPLLVVLHVTYKGVIDRAHDQIEQLTRIASYEAALRSTGDGVIVTDARGCVALINPAAEQLIGCAERDAIGKDAAAIFRLRSLSTKEDAAFVPEDGSNVREYVLVRADGSECPIDAMHARVRDHRGNVTGAIRTFRDISQRKASERERETLLDRERAARAAADAANRLKDEFLATLSHELRTPTTGILGWVRLLKTGRLDSEQVQQALGALERGALAQAAVLEDLLDMSRIVRGALRLEPRTTDVRQVLKSAVETVDPAVRSKGLQLQVDIPADVPLVSADPDRLRQVFWNLLTNAVKFTDRGGSIRVLLRPETDHLRIDVADTGRGIDAESLPYIFDRFRQADSSSTRSHGGLGLGLAIARHLVESHGGTLTAASEGHGRGARFTVRLPVLVPSADSGRLDAAS
jgi:PAS domain S-box-containing protein